MLLVYIFGCCARATSDHAAACCALAATGHAAEDSDALASFHVIDP
jgi:hypothetical protein